MKILIFQEKEGGVIKMVNSMREVGFLEIIMVRELFPKTE